MKQIATPVISRSSGSGRSFGMRVISGNMEIAGPAHSPDEAPCDYFLWGICDQEIQKVKARDLGEPQEVMSDFVKSMDEDLARRALRDVRPMARMCIKMGGITAEEIQKGNDWGVKISRTPALIDT